MERITGRTLDQALQELVFTPLGMWDSSYDWRRDYEANYVVGHSAGGTAIDRCNLGEPKAASTLRTTSGDYARFLVAMMTGDGLQAASLGAMLTAQVQLGDCLICLDDENQTDPLSPALAWGLGWGLQHTAQGLSFWHWGDNGNYRNYVVAFPEQKIGLVYLTNSENGLAIRDELVRRVIGGDHPAFDWLTYPQIP